MTSNLTPSSEIALRAALGVAISGKWTTTMDECLKYVRRTYPIMGKVVTAPDIAKQLRKLKFLRDHEAGPGCYRHRDHAAVKFTKSGPRFVRSDRDYADRKIDGLNIGSRFRFRISEGSAE